jgi:hypothetical protein
MPLGRGLATWKPIDTPRAIYWVPLEASNESAESDVEKLKKIADEVEAYIKAELTRECDDCVKAIIVSPPDWRGTQD